MALITVISLRQPDQVSKTEPWPGGPKSYLQQPVMATPVMQQKMEEPQDSCFNFIGAHQSEMVASISIHAK